MSSWGVFYRASLRCPPITVGHQNQNSSWILSFSPWLKWLKCTIGVHFAERWLYWRCNLMLNNALPKFSTEMKRVITQTFLEKRHKHRWNVTQCTVSSKGIWENYAPAMLSWWRKCGPSPTCIMSDMWLISSSKTSPNCKSICQGIKPSDPTAGNRVFEKGIFNHTAKNYQVTEAKEKSVFVDPWPWVTPVILIRKYWYKFYLALNLWVCVMGKTNKRARGREEKQRRRWEEIPGER